MHTQVRRVRKATGLFDFRPSVPEEDVIFRSHLRGRLPPPPEKPFGITPPDPVFAHDQPVFPRHAPLRIGKRVTAILKTNLT